METFSMRSSDIDPPIWSGWGRPRRAASRFREGSAAAFGGDGLEGLEFHRAFIAVAAAGIDPASTKMFATPSMNSCAAPPSQRSDNWSETDGNTKVEIRRPRCPPDPDMPEYLRDDGQASPSTPSPEFHISLASAVTLRKLATRSGFSATKAAGGRCQRRTRECRVPPLSAPVRRTLPSSFMRPKRAAPPPQPQTMS